MPISELRVRVRRELLEFAWSQWAQLGLSAHPTRFDQWAIDPEALLLFTIVVARRDPRLFDELLDWVSLNARLLNLQRLRNLVPHFPIDRRLVDAVLSSVGESTPSLRWPKIGQEKRMPKGKGVPVFSPDVASFVGEPDPVFQRFGYLRPRADRSGKATEPDVRAAPNLAFRMRLIFGAGTRSEVMRIMLTFTDGPLDAARIAQEAGFAKRNINEALTGLVASGVVKARWSGNERVFTILRDKWVTLLEIEPSAAARTFVSWVHLLPALSEALVWLEERGVEGAESDYMMSSRARDLVARIEPNLEVLGLTPPDGHFRPGATYLPQFVETVESLLGAIDNVNLQGAK